MEMVEICIIRLSVSIENYSHINDNELLQRFRQTGDNHWLGILLQRYTLLLFGVCMKYLKEESEAQDAVQQIFLKVLTDIEKYKIDYFKSWLYMVAKNHCLSLLRDRKGKMPLAFVDNNQFAIEPVKLTEPTIVSDEVLAMALEQLNEEQKQCVILFYLQKKTYQQISQETGYSLLQVKSYIQNGKRNLKLIIEKKLHELNVKNG